ncbi:SGNH/GDSL hydrolase family protein [Sphingobium sp. BS19]|uniref:SGNH/GDSL hydrolase family protein n=1 Tax=Sphingobium sp. BS19 TaxID=3018973 RepID=UPI0022EE6877|nr:SGNH/GDSL hydrolase family protein [Sphingobium sp. BS19]GLJ00294.1 hypothetical protein Sbs19_41110 [Sphingobium sp. BS19]
MPRTSGSLGGLSNAALAKAALAATTPLGASIGDSIATADYNGSDRVTLPPAPTNILKSAKGILTWALILCGQRVQVPTTTNIWGFPGETTATILTNLPAFHAQMPRKPAFMYVHCGTNDVKDGLSFETIVANWEAIAQFNAQRNCRTIFAPILPRTSGFSALFTAAQFQVMDRCNRWLARFAARAQGMVAVASACLPDIADPASVGAQPRAGYTYDGTHPAIAGGYYAGKAVAAILRTWYPPIDLLPRQQSGLVERTDPRQLCAEPDDGRRQRHGNYAVLRHDQRHRANELDSSDVEHIRPDGCPYSGGVTPYGTADAPDDIRGQLYGQRLYGGGVGAVRSIVPEPFHGVARVHRGGRYYRSTGGVRDRRRQ